MRQVRTGLGLPTVCAVAALLVLTGVDAGIQSSADADTEHSGIGT